MFRTVVGVDGMACGHCEKHLCDAISEKCQVKKVTASRERKECEIISESELTKLRSVKPSNHAALNFLQ